MATTRLEHRGGLAFELELQGHRFGVDASAELGGQGRGPQPKPLVLSALAGCTGMDVVSILAKMQMPFDSFAIEVDGTLTLEHPKVYSAVHIRYILAGARAERAKIEKAINLSLDKYCGVAAMLKKTASLSWELVIN